MKTKLVQFRVTEDEFRALEAAASGAGQGPHVYVRSVLREHMERGRDADTDLAGLRDAIASLAAERLSQDDLAGLEAALEALHSSLANATLLILNAVGMEAAEANRRVNAHVQKKSSGWLPQTPT